MASGVGSLQFIAGNECMQLRDARAIYDSEEPIYNMKLSIF